MSSRSRLLAVTVAALVVSLGGVGAAGGVTTDLFISEYIEGSGQNKAIEIYNGTGAPVNLGAGGWNLFISFNGGTSSRVIDLTGTVAAGDVYVIAQATADPAILAQADQTDTSTSWFNGDDAVVLRKDTTTLVDTIGQVGFDPGTEWGSGLTSTADNTIRRKPTIQAGDTNASDAFDPAVEWDGFAQNTFDGLGTHTVTTGGDAAPTVASTTPGSGAGDVATNANITVDFSEPVVAAAGWYTISCTSSGVHTAAQSGGPQSYTLDPDSDFAADESCTVTLDASKITDADADDPPDNMAANHTWSFTTVAPTLRIHEIQGAGHLSPHAGRRTSFVPGVVTAVRNNGFWMQDPLPDGSDATSEGIFVFTSSRPTVIRGMAVTVSGLITEFRPGGAGTDNLTTTELERVTVYPGGPGAIPATVVGVGGRVPPGLVIEDDADGSVESSGTFDPAQDGIDFYESLEGMLLQVNDALAVGPTNGFGELFVVGDNGAGAGVRTSRGGVLIRDVDLNPLGDYRSGDFNPERMQLDDVLADTPDVHVGDTIPGATVGVLSYDFGNFELLPLTAPVAASGGIQRETTQAPGANELSIGTFNVENLDPSDAPTIPRLARIVVENMRSPDLIGIEEMQDNTGGVNDGTTDASLSWQAFIGAIVAVGGPRYEYRQIDPQNNQDGGQPGGNIRVGFLFRTDRGLTFVDRPGGDATTPTGVFRQDGGAHLTLSPGRVDPANPAWEATRKPLAGEFLWNDKTLIAVVNHFSSKGGDDPLFGRWQPPIRSTEVARHQQAASVNAFVEKILAAERKANVVVLGDINDFEFSKTTEILEGGVLVSLMHTLPQPERYSYVFEGNSQVLDQILFSDNMLRGLDAYDVVHVNAEFFDQASDHDPSVARVKLLGAAGGGR